MDSRFAVQGVTALSPLAEAAPALLLAKAEPLFELEKAAASGADMDAVHDMRVASRRLRETMRLLEPLYPGRDFKKWYRRVRHITRTLGPVRDADVFIDAFGKMSRDVGSGGRRAVAFLVGWRMGRREHELAVLNRELASLNLAKNRRKLRKLAASVASSPDAKRTLASFAHASVAERTGVVFGALPNALPEDNLLEQHALRIDFKRLRYAVEVFAPVYGDDFDDLHDVLTTFQDTLGDLHDLHLFLDMLREPATLSAAKRAGVSASDIAEVSALIDTMAKQRYDAFIALTEAHPASEMLPALLLPLSRVPEPAQGEAPEQAEARPASEPEAPAGEPAEPAAPQLAVVLEPAAPIAGPMPPIDPNAQPWRSDAAGLAIEPPVVIGAEPWARPTLASVAPAEPTPPAATPPAAQPGAGALDAQPADSGAAPDADAPAERP